jgi:hypothetical protein
MATDVTGRLGRGAVLIVLFGGLLVALLDAASARPSAAQEKKADEKKPGPTPTRGAPACQGCHMQGDPTKDPEYQLTKSFEFVRLQENQIWGNHDLHAKAYDNLSTPLGKRMEALLKKYGEASGDKEYGPNYSVTTDPKCLACHASLTDPSSPAAARTADSFLNVFRQDPKTGAFLKDPKTGELVVTKEGVGCEMCHGPGRDYIDPHKTSGDLLKKETGFGAVKLVDWREWPPEEKAKKHFTNLRDPVVAAQTCASCHIGSPKEGRFATHLMYAVGHPPLPPVDVLSFTREQPRHWGLPRQMPYLRYVAEKEPEKAWKYFRYRAEADKDGKEVKGGEVYLGRRFAETTLATLGASMAFLEQQVPDPKDETAKKAFQGLDYAAFDCYACHHDLKYPSDRQARGFLGTPGRPQFRAAQFALARVIVAHAAKLPDGKELGPEVKLLDDDIKELARAFGAKTYGDPDLVRAAAEKLKNRCKTVVDKLAAVRYTRAATHDLMLAIADAAQQPIADPEVAELYAWAFDTLRTELRDSAGAMDPEGWAKAHEALSRTVVARLRPKIPDHEVRPADNLPPTNTESVESRLNARTQLFNSFRYDDFQKAFGKAAALYRK